MNQPTANESNPLSAILQTGFIAGFLDAAAASISFYIKGRITRSRFGDMLPPEFLEKKPMPIPTVY